MDTGSTDNTIQIAENMGAEVSMFPWNDSFSDARNRSLEMAQHPWILYVDADDSVPEKSLCDISELKQQPPEKAYGFVITSTQDGVTGMASAQIRMFPNSKENRLIDVAAWPMTWRPVSDEPTSVINLGILLSLSVFPTTEEGPEMILNTPLGNPIFSPITPR